MTQNVACKQADTESETTTFVIIQDKLIHAWYPDLLAPPSSFCTIYLSLEQNTAAMQKRYLILILLCFPLQQFVSAQEKQLQNMAGMGVTFQIPLSPGMYLDDPFNIWPDQEPSYITRLFYARMLSPVLSLGAYAELGRIKFSHQTEEIRSYRRMVAGLEWLARYPQKPLHMQLGGYAGYALIRADNWDDLHGADFGMLAGPAYEKKHFGVAAQVKAGVSPFKSSGTPEGLLLFAPGVILKMYARF